VDADYRKCISEYEHYSIKIRSLREKKEVPEEKMEANLQKLKQSQNAMDSAASSVVCLKPPTHLQLKII
jgi:hypothetical protein